MGTSQSRGGLSGESAFRSDLEARFVVLEIISMTSLALALDTSENADIEHARGITSLVRETIRQRCRELNMSEAGQRSAAGYADELLATALSSLYPSEE
jgi:hypothetical protein